MEPNLGTEPAPSGRRPGEPVAFVGCGARSGSTLLRFLLDSHPALACPSETDVAVLLDGFAATTRALGGAGGDPRAQGREAVEAMAAALLARTGKREWCDKSLSNALHLDTLAAAWPGARFLLLHRHCMDFVMSALDAQPWGLADYGFASFAAVTPTDPVVALVAYWLDRTSRLLAFEERHPTRCLRLTYEALVERPAEVAASIFGFLGLPPAPGVPEAAFRTRHEGSGPGDYKVWYTQAVHRDPSAAGARVPAERVSGLGRSSVNGLLSRLGYAAVGDRWGSGDTDPAGAAQAGTDPGGTDLGGPGPAGPDAAAGPGVDLRVLDGHRVLWRTRLAPAVELAAAAGRPGDAAGTVTVAVERPTADDLAAGRENMGRALRARTVRYYGPPLRDFDEERAIFAGVAAELRERAGSWCGAGG